MQVAWPVAKSVSLLCLLSVILLLPGCGAGTAGSVRTDLRLPLHGDPGIPDPTLAVTPSSLFLSSLLYSGLVKFGPDLHIIPELAVSIPTISQDGLTYTFTIRQDARFADGRHCTASDVAYSLTRALLPATQSPWAAHFLGNIRGARALQGGTTDRLAGVRILDRLTIRIRLVHPDAMFLDKLAFPVAAVVDRRVIDAYTRGEWIGHPAGTGPWQVAARQRDGTLLLTQRHHFYGGPIQVHSLQLVPVRDAGAALDLYRHGKIDVASVPAPEYAGLSQRSDFHDSPSLDAYYALPDPRVGRRLAATLNRDTLANDLGPALSALTSIVPPGVPDYVPSPPTIDPPSSGSARMSVRIHLAQPPDWITTHLRDALYHQWIHNDRGPLVRIVHAWAVIPDPGIWLRVVLPQTRSHWYRTMLTHSGELTQDPVTRMNTYSTGENWALSNAYVIPLVSARVGYLLKPTVEGLQVTPIGLMPANNTWTTITVR